MTGKQLRELRESADLGRPRLARSLELSEKTLKNWERAPVAKRHMFLAYAAAIREIEAGAEVLTSVTHREQSRTFAVCEQQTFALDLPAAPTMAVGHTIGDRRAAEATAPVELPLLEATDQAPQTIDQVLDDAA